MRHGAAASSRSSCIGSFARVIGNADDLVAAALERGAHVRRGEAAGAGDEDAARHRRQCEGAALATPQVGSTIMRASSSTWVFGCQPSACARLRR